MVHSRKTSSSSMLRATSENASKPSSKANSPKHLSPAVAPVEDKENIDAIDFIAYTQAQVEENVAIEDAAEQNLRAAMVGATYGAAGDSTTFGNPRGIELLEEHHDQKERNKRMEAKLDAVLRTVQQQNAKIEGQDAKIEGQNAKIEDLKTQVRTLNISSQGHRAVRHRFLDVYRRDGMGERDRTSTARISAGNVVAHHGDCVTDADLFACGERTDVRVFTQIYGLTPDEVRQLVARKDDDTVRTINKFGTLKVDTTRNLPTSLHEAYDKFLNQLGLCGDNADVSDLSTKLGQAYSKVWHEFGKL